MFTTHERFTNYRLSIFLSVQCKQTQSVNILYGRLELLCVYLWSSMTSCRSNILMLVRKSRRIMSTSWREERERERHIVIDCWHIKINKYGGRKHKEGKQRVRESTTQQLHKTNTKRTKITIQ